MGAAAKKSKSDFEEELLRIEAHYSGEKPLKIGKLDFVTNEEGREYLRKLIYDITLMYDLWFTKEKFEKPDDIGKDTTKTEE